MRRSGRLVAPALVLAGRQTAGRGRGDHVWWSGPGCITATFVFPVDEQFAPHQIPLLCGLAVRNAAAELTGSDAIQLKWPNDVLHDGRKVAGLLCERVERVDLIGLGLNVNLDPAQAPAPLRDRLTSLSRIAAAPLDLMAALSTVATHLHQMLTRRTEQSFKAMLKEYDTHHALRGRKVTAHIGDGEIISGHCEGLDEMGRLLLRKGAKLERIIAGEIGVS